MTKPDHSSTIQPPDIKREGREFRMNVDRRLGTNEGMDRYEMLKILVCINGLSSFGTDDER